MADYNRGSRTRRGRSERTSLSQNKRSSRTSESTTSTSRLKIGQIDYVILLSVLFLVAYGVIMVFSASYYYAKNTFNDTTYFFKRQAISAVIGFIVMIFISKMNYQIFRKFAKFIYFGSFIFLIILLLKVPGITVTTKGATRWFQLGPINFQPSEITKLGMILYLPDFICRNKGILKTFMGFVKCCFVFFVPAVLILLEPNMSTALVICIIGMAIIFVATPKLLYVIGTGVLGAVGAVSYIALGGGFRAQRFAAWLDPFADASDTGFQTVQSLLAIASGGFFGLGLGQSRQKLGFIPEAHNDIIFSIICEELGVCGAAILIVLFGVLIWRGYHTAMEATNSYSCYVASGITTMIAVQAIINIAVVTNTIPNTGVPLPFISYGGTSLVIMMASVGILMSISRVFED